jgi:hypothetical protein
LTFEEALWGLPAHQTRVALAVSLGRDVSHSPPSTPCSDSSTVPLCVCEGVPELPQLTPPCCAWLLVPVALGYWCLLRLVTGACCAWLLVQQQAGIASLLKAPTLLHQKGWATETSHGLLGSSEHHYKSPMNGVHWLFPEQSSRVPMFCSRLCAVVVVLRPCHALQSCSTLLCGGCSVVSVCLANSIKVVSRSWGVCWQKWPGQHPYCVKVGGYL